MNPKSHYDHPEEWLAEFEKIFSNLHLKWAVIGGVGAQHYRFNLRGTVDLDFVVDRLSELIDLFEEQGFIFRVLKEHNDSPYLLQGITPDGMHFDIYEAHTDFEKCVLARRLDTYASPEDIIVYKLIAWRSLDQDDIAEILTTQTELDHGYIEKWAWKWDVLDNWHTALAKRVKTNE